MTEEITVKSFFGMLFENKQEKRDRKLHQNLRSWYSEYRSLDATEQKEFARKYRAGELEVKSGLEKRIEERDRRENKKGGAAHTLPLSEPFSTLSREHMQEYVEKPRPERKIFTGMPFHFAGPGMIEEQERQNKKGAKQ